MCIIAKSVQVRILYVYASPSHQTIFDIYVYCVIESTSHNLLFQYDYDICTLNQKNNQRQFCLNLQWRASVWPWSLGRGENRWPEARLASWGAYTDVQTTEILTSTEVHRFNLYRNLQYRSTDHTNLTQFIKTSSKGSNEQRFLAHPNWVTLTELLEMIHS